MASLTATPYAPQIKPYDPVRGGNARYDTSGLQQIGSGYTTDGTYIYDPNGLSTNRPDDLSNMTDFSGGSSGGGGGFGPEFDQMMQDLKAQSVSDKASRDAAIQRSYVNFGLGNIDLAAAAKTTGIGDLASVIDQNTMNAAANNKFSVMERLKLALADQQRSNRISLRQRGGVRSGESGFLGQRAQTAFDTDTYDATQKLLDYISGAQQGYAQAERARQMQAWQAALAAAMRGGYGGGGGGGGGYVEPQAAAPSTYTNPATGNTWTQVGGQGGEWTRWPGKAS